MRRPSLRSVQKVDALDGAATKFRALAQAPFMASGLMIYVAPLQDWVGDILSAKCLLSSSRFGALLSSPCVQFQSRGFDLLQTFENSAKARVLTGGA